MSERNNEFRGSAGGNFETVVFDVVAPPKKKVVESETKKVYDVDPIDYESRMAYTNPKSKFRGVCWCRDKTRKAGGCFKSGISLDDGVRKSLKRSKSEIKCAMAFDKYIEEHNLARTTNYDLYGEYWK